MVENPQNYIDTIKTKKNNMGLKEIYYFYNLAYF